MVASYYQKFLTSIRWSSFEQLAYQGILVLHQTALSYVLGLSAYGAAGVTFASIYLISNLGNLGLDSTLSPFIKQAMSSKSSFKKIIVFQLVLQFLLFACIIGLVLKGHASYLLARLLPHTELLPLVVMAGLIESYKKTLRIVLQNVFYIKEAAFIAVLSMALYVGTVWTLYVRGVSLTMPHLILPLIGSSLLCIVLLVHKLFSIYRQLPLEAVSSPNLFKRLLKIRMIGTGQRISSQFFSSNLLIPLSALFFGAGQAGIITLVNSYTTFILSFIKKALEVSSSALFSQSNTLAREEKQLLFNKVTGTSYYILSLLAMVIIILYPSLIRFISGTAYSTMPVILFLTFQFSENFLIMYEKFFIAEEKGSVLFSVTAATLFLYVATLYNYHLFVPAFALSFIMLIRLATLAFFILFSWKQWGIQPAIPNPRHIAYTATACAVSAYALSFF